MNRNSVPVLWMGGSFAVAAALAGTVLVYLGTDPKSLGAALRLTARWSFLLFWLAYAGGPIAVLFGSAFAPLARRGRTFGLAFAAAHLVHVGLVVWLYQTASQPPLSTALFVFFAGGLFWIYLLAVLSFGGMIQALGPRLWRWVRLLGMNYILLAFGRDFLTPLIQSEQHSTYAHLAAYVPFAALAVAAPLLSLAAATRGRDVRHAAA